MGCAHMPIMQAVVVLTASCCCTCPCRQGPSGCDAAAAPAAAVPPRLHAPRGLRSCAGRRLRSSLQQHHLSRPPAAGSTGRGGELAAVGTAEGHDMLPGPPVTRHQIYQLRHCQCPQHAVHKQPGHERPVAGAHASHAQVFLRSLGAHGLSTHTCSVHTASQGLQADCTALR